MSAEQLKESLKEVLPNQDYTDEELTNFISLALLDASMIANIKAGSSFEDLTEGLKGAILVGAKALAMRSAIIKKAMDQTTFGEKEMTMDLDIETTTLAKQYNDEVENFKKLCILNKNNIKIFGK